MRIIGLDQAEDAERAAAFLASCPFLAEAWPGQRPQEAAQEIMDQRHAGAWWALEDQGAWRWLLGLEPLAFDSEVFGLPLGRLNPLAHAEAWPSGPAQAQGRLLLSQALELARGRGLEGLVARVGSRDFLAAKVLEGAGFSLADLSVEWLLDLASLSGQAPDPPAGMSLRPWVEGDREPLKDLAAKSFCDLESYADRFALDPAMRPGCPEMYRRWLENCFRGQQADQVLVLESQGQPAGFVSLKMPRAQAGAQAGCGWVALNALRPDLRGRGLYNLMLRHGLDWLAAQGARRARVRTKLSQAAVIRAWSRLGARQVHADVTFHLWL